jgi:hypothetical protein
MYYTTIASSEFEALANKNRRNDTVGSAKSPHLPTP